MKYYMFICGFIILLLTGCSQKEEIKNTTITENLSSSVPVHTGLAQFTESDFFSWTYLGWIYTPIFISGDYLIISWAFSLSIPKEITNKIYSSQYTPITKSYYERIWFTSKDKEKSFTMYISKLVWPDTTYTDKDLCQVEYFDWFISKSEKTKEINWNNIYIYYANLLVSAPDIEPFEVIDSQFCLVRSWMLYKFSASNYTHEYINNIINSINFF